MCGIVAELEQHVVQYGHERVTACSTRVERA
jgi:hypothetical protein